MHRITKKLPDGSIEYRADIDKVIEQLAFFEEVYFTTLARQAMVEQQLQMLELNGKKDTPTYKELLGEKLKNGYFIAAFIKTGNG